MKHLISIFIQSIMWMIAALGFALVFYSIYDLSLKAQNYASQFIK